MNVYFTLYAILNPDLWAEGNPLLDALAAMPDFKTMSEGFSREDIAALGHSALKSPARGCSSNRDFSWARHPVNPPLHAGFRLSRPIGDGDGGAEQLARAGFGGMESGTWNTSTLPGA